MQPLVSVICLCYNHKRFVREAVESVVHQSYKNIQIIVVDDYSTDGSRDEIQKLSQEYPALEVMLLNSNVGNCKAFNQGLTLARGEYLVDLAADDILLPPRIEMGVQSLQQGGEAYGINFSDADWIDEDGNHLWFHSDRFPHDQIPQGDIYKELIMRYFISPPTVMFTRAVSDYLGGYDETLTYEDFDFQIRSSRKFKYCYSKEILVKKRVTGNALSSQQFKFFSRHSNSTFRVCKKIMELNRSEGERIALTKRIRYEIFLNIRLLNWGIVIKYFLLLMKNSRIKFS